MSEAAIGIAHRQVQAATAGLVGWPGSPSARSPLAAVESSAGITARGVRKTYGSRTALDCVDVEVLPGEFFGLIGPNGAGKTTLMEIVEGLQTPDSGVVSVLGDVPARRDPALLRRIGIQPQSTAFFARSRVKEHLTTLAELFGVDRRRVGELLELFGLAGCAATRVEKLSGGERQKLAVASALIHSPEVLFLDEPTAAMDAEARAELVRLLHKIRNSGATVLYTTHLLYEAEQLCDRVAVLFRGRILTTASPAELLARSGLPSKIVLPRAVHQADLVSSLRGVLGIDVGPDGLIVQADDAALMVTALSRAGVDVEKAQIRQVGLEDVFLKLTGNEYHHE
jgi:ABC-2 type transport system ATP-binding protein